MVEHCLLTCIIKVQKGRALLRLGVQWSIIPTDEILTELVNLLGESAVELEFE